MYPERNHHYILTRKSKQTYCIFAISLVIFLFGCSNHSFGINYPSSIDGPSDTYSEPTITDESAAYQNEITRADLLDVFVEASEVDEQDRETYDEDCFIQRLTILTSNSEDFDILDEVMVDCWDTLRSDGRYKLQIAYPSGVVVTFDINNENGSLPIDPNPGSGKVAWQVIGIDDNGKIISILGPFTFDIPPDEEDANGMSDSLFFVVRPNGEDLEPPIINIPEICFYTALKNVNCRESDHMGASIIAILLQGDQGKIIAINPPLTHGKFELESQQECWIYLGLMDGPEDPVDNCQIAVVKAPLPVIIQNNNQPDPKSCSKDLGQSACLAAGGSWVDGGAVGASYCDC